MDWFDQLDDLKRPTVEQKAWMKEVDLRLATVDDLDTIAAECIEAGIYGLDLETTGLDQRSFDGASGRRETVDKIAGYCIAPTTEKGWYIPVRHRDDGSEANVPPRLVSALIRKIQEGGARAVFHNAKFDQKFLDCEPAGKAGDWDDPGVWELAEARMVDAYCAWSAQLYWGGDESRAAGVCVELGIEFPALASDPCATCAP